MTGETWDVTSQPKIKPTVLYARLAWTAIMTPPTDIFTDQPQHAGGFLTVSFSWFPDTYPPDIGGTAHPIYGSVCATEEKREFAGC